MLTLPLVTRAHTDPSGVGITSDVHGSASWAEAADVVLRLAERIRTFDLGDVRRVMVVARNRPSTVIAHAAALLGEAAAVPVNFHLTAGEIEYQVSESSALLMFVDGATEAAAREATAGTTVTVVRLPDVGVTGDELEAFLAGTAPIELRIDQPVLPSLLFTSGTTGRPKAVQLPPKTIGDTPDLGGLITLITTQRMARYGTHLVVGPMYHNGPLTAVRLFLAGVPLVVHASFDAAATLAAIEAHRIESSVMVPTHFVRCLALADDVRAAHDLSSLKCVVHTGGACPVDVKRQMLEWWGLVLYESYGGTESGSTCSIGPEEWLAHPGSVGRAVAPFVALVVDEEGNPLPPNTEGRLYFRDTTGRGIRYEGDPQKTAEAHLEPGVFTLGEIGRIDDDGFVYITDRFNDMVVSGGVNIYPAEAEQALQQHPAVADVACIGLPDAEMGERLVAVVQLQPGASVTAGELSAWSRERLAGYKCPRTYLFTDTLPRNPMGKLDKKALRATYRPAAT
jgi:long-chain acyl-CoA synthetase